MATKVVSRRVLNRALLERQLLVRRCKLRPAAAIERLVGLQAQATNPPFHGLWSRLVNFDQRQLDELITSRQVVRAATMRGTLHLHTADDFLTIRAVVQPGFERAMQSTYAKVLDGMDVNELAKVGRELLAGEPLTFGQLRDGLLARWPGRHPTMVTNAVRTQVPLVQVPPCGTWDRSGPRVYTTIEKWLDRPVSAEPAVESLISRYLSVFGPATVADVQNWSGLTRLGEVVERMRPTLRTLRTEDGAELFDLPRGALPDPDLPVPVRLVAEFDNVVLGHADRSRIVPDKYRKRIMTVNGIVRGTVLSDGFVAGLWKIQRTKTAATLVVTPFSVLDQEATEAEALSLLRFTAPTSEHQVSFEAGTSG
ncbi:winged helix DNA-binding domain-containing protein [Fodinicola feengrottensis]|uniref:winged helix DNA-binding domain-containing protein n=1 Tax=Fodinicola feengrottensis TaxID=435914 RepID=UPI0031E1CCE9